MISYFAIITPVYRDYEDFVSRIEVFYPNIVFCQIQSIEQVLGKMFIGYKLAYRYYDIKDLDKIIELIKIRKFH